MSTSALPTTLYPASHFVESAGCIIFHLASAQICLIRHLERDHWLLPKGRRNLHESRPTASLREVQEETGYACRLLPITMRTRCPPAVGLGADDPNHPDLPRDEREITEPFMLMVRDTTTATCTKDDVFGDAKSVKLIWWYVATYEGNIEHGPENRAPKAEEWGEVAWFGYQAAIEKLSFETDREVTRSAIDIVKLTYPAGDPEKEVL
ncbi:MAG: hypothetical protein M1821_007937 [Bathelium mastoideum]|nr:MAG: hypothetical protein M1821_007937 [Bathelium mastoideum]